MDDALDLSYLEGSVSSVIFRNEENGYTVLRVETEEGEQTLVGIIPGVTPGEGICAHGTWEQHSSYGRQLKAEVVARTLPVGEDAVYRYLASGVIRGIGISTARRLVDAFGAEALTIIEETPERLTEIRGITKKRAEAIGEALRTQVSMRRLLDFLSLHALPLQAAIPLYRRFGEAALSMIRNNPYLLTDESIGAAFHTADTLALSLGFPNENPLRLEAGLLFELLHNADRGHVFLPRGKLLRATSQLLRVEETSLAAALEGLSARAAIVTAEIAGETACYLARLHDCECAVAQRFAEMAGESLHVTLDVDALLNGIEAVAGIAYAPLQREAVHTAAARQCMLLTGGPGTGKTTSLRAVLALFEKMGLDTVLVAPTGRAAKRLGEACGMEGSTIHRLLETRYDAKRGSLSFARNEEAPLTAEAVIVDEASMVDLPLMHALLLALPSACRLILVGDPQQLPSVGPGNVLSDLLRAGRVPTLRLNEIFRQAAQSTIVRNAHSVNRGELPELRNSKSGDFFFLRRAEPAAALETVVELCRTRLPSGMGIPAEQIQVLSPTRRGPLGTISLNRALQAALNPPAIDKAERMFGELCFRTGDRVMQIKNNYDLMWQDREGREFGMGIFNGDIGHIDSVDGKSGLVVVDFEGKLSEYTPDLLHQLEPAYAVTVHKAQGSEYRAVILCTPEAANMLLTRGVLYTGITRARELLVLVGEEGLIARMAHNDRPTRRYSGLRARLVRLEAERTGE